MALTDESNGNGFYMPVAPAAYGYGGNNGNNSFGGDWGWIILLLLLAGNGGWGMGGFGGMGMMMNGGFGWDYPWLANGQQNIMTNTNNGFRDAMLNDGITSIRDGISGLSTQLCGCCSDMQMAMANGFRDVSAQMYNSDMAALNRSFAEQTANTQGFFGVQQGISDLRYTTATEACATRNNDTQNTQAILTALTAGVQSIKDQLCQDKIDAKNDEIAQLRQENLYARGQASQIAQNSAIINGVYDRLATCPVDTTPVYGRQPIFTCPVQVNGNNGCGCGCGNF